LPAVTPKGVMSDPEGEVVVVTGASAGVGRATVRAFGKRRAKVGLLARGRAGLEAARREVEEPGGQALVLPTDVADAAREWYVGFPTVKAIVGNQLVPSLGDWVLSREGYEGQMYDGPEPPDRPHNLYHPRDDAVDHGAHGDFDARASDWSWQVWADRNRNALCLLGGAVVGLLWGLSRAGGRKRVEYGTPE